jgi:hypothetical protein
MTDAEIQLTNVGYIRLHNTGVFDCELEFIWLDPKDNSQHKSAGSGKTIHVNQTETSDPGRWGVPDGARVYPYINVHLGDDHEGSLQDGLVYATGLNWVAEYHIWGVTRDNHLRLDGFGPSTAAATEAPEAG